MNKLLCTMIFLLMPLFVFGGTYPRGWEYSEPPTDDEFLTNRFGRTWSDPIYNGYLIVDDHYVDAPYIVEQRGFVILINGERVEDGIDIRMASPLKREPVIEDPGPPPSEFVKNSPLYLVLGHPYHKKYESYWDHLGLRDQARVDANIRFFQSLPCISNVVDTKGSGVCPGSRCLNISDNNGLTLQYHMGLVPRTTPVHQDSALYTYLPGVQMPVVDAFQNNRYLLVCNAGILANHPGPEPNELVKWYVAFSSLASSALNATQRFERLQSVHMIGTNDTMRYCEMTYPIHGFHTSSQLWQRLSGDMSWTNDGPARMFALTNGWQKILPAFMRTQTVAVATMVSAPSEKTRTIDTQQPKKHGKPVHKGSSPATSTQESDGIPMSFSSITWWFIGCTALVIIGLAVLWRHNSKGRNV